VAAGTSTITVTIGGKSATASASVASSTPTVATVTVAPGSSAIQVGNQVQLTATDKTSSGTVVNGQSVTWSSSNTAVATVSSSGIVTAVSAGGGGGPYHEPTGMTAQINTGAMSASPSTSSGGTWTEGSTSFTNWSPNTMSST